MQGRGAAPRPNTASAHEMNSLHDPQLASADAVVDFWSALDRLFNIGAFYPEGHARCDEVARTFLDALRAQLSGSPTLAIDAGRDALAVQGKLVPLETRGARRLCGMMATLGVARIEFDAAATPHDLYVFTASLLRSKHQADTAVGLRELALEGLPPTVRVIQREFGRRVGGEAGLALRADQVQAAVMTVLEELENRQLDAATREAYRGLIEKLFTRVAERLDMDQPLKGGARAPFTRSLDDVLKLGVHAIRYALEQGLPERGEVSDLRDLFAYAEKAVALSDDRPSVELMLDVLRQSARESGASENRNSTPDESADNDTLYEIPLAELVRRLLAGDPRTVTSQTLTPPDGAEHVSVLLQILLADASPATATGAAAALRQALTEPWRPGERAVVASALRQIAQRGGNGAADHVLPSVLGPLRSIDAAGPAELLGETCAGAPPAGARAVWPHVVNELLLGAEGVSLEAMETLRHLAACLTEETMQEDLGRLEALDALREGCVARRHGLPLSAETAPLCAVLLGSSRGDLLGPALLAALQAAPPPWPGFQALPLLGEEYHPRQRPFLARLLREGARGEPSPALLTATGRVIVEELPALRRSRRGERWVPTAIRALGELRADGARPVLEAIVRARRWLILPAWPAACRRAADETLRRLGSEPPPAPPTEEARP